MIYKIARAIGRVIKPLYYIMFILDVLTILTGEASRFYTIWVGFYVGVDITMKLMKKYRK